MMRKNGSYCGLSDEARQSIRQMRLAYQDVMTLKGKALERVTHVALASFVKEGAPVVKNPFDESGKRQLVKVR